MTVPVFCCGAECGVIDATAAHFITQTGTATFSTTTVRSGARSIRFNPAAAIIFVLLGPPSNTRWVGRFYIRFATLPNAAIPLARASSTGPRVEFLNTDSKIYANVNGTRGATGVAVTTGVWYRIDFDFNINTGGADFCDVQVDGTACGQATATGSSGAEQVSIGAIATCTADFFIDDIVLSNTAADYPFGEGKVVSYIPNADGTHTIASASDFFQETAHVDCNGRTDNWTMIDDRPLESTVGDFLNAQFPPVSTDYIECLFEDSAEASAPRGVEIIGARHQAGTGVGDMRVVLRDLNGSTEDAWISQVAQAGSTTLVYHRKHYAAIPGGGAWTLTAFNNLAVRFSLGGTGDANPDQYFDCVMLEAEYATGPVLTPGRRLNVNQAVNRAAVI